MPLLKLRTERRERKKFAKLLLDHASETTSSDLLSDCSSTLTSEQASVNESEIGSPPKQDQLKGFGSPVECPGKRSQASDDLAWQGSNGDSRQTVAIQPQCKPDLTTELECTGEDVNPADESSKDLWERAYESLRCSREGGEYMQKYEKILQANMESKANLGKTSVEDHRPDRFTQMSALAINKMQAIDDSKWNFRVGEHSVEMKKILEQTVKAIVFAKDFVSSAASSEPHAALAWAGVSMLLPLILSPTDQRESLAKGIEYMSTLIVRFTTIERSYKQQQSRMKHHLTPDREKLHTAFESHITKLYAQILNFQAKAVCQLYKSSLQRYALDAIKINNWGTMLSEIKEQEMECEKYFDVIGSAALDDAFKQQHEQVELLLQSQEKLFQAWNMEKMHDRDDKAQRHQSKQETEALKALCTTTYRDHKNRNPDRVENTCRWFLESEKYISWRSMTGSGMLWVTADPGCGKSVLAKSLIDRELQSKTQTTIYWFFKDDSDEQRSAVHALCALLHQLCSSKPELLPRVAETYRRNGFTLMLSFSWLWDLFMELTDEDQAGEVVCVLDALDECRLEERQILIDHLNKFHRSKEQSNRKLRFLITSRPYLDIEERFDKIVLRLAGEEASEIITEEIDIVIRASVARIVIRKQLDPNTQTLLEDRLLGTQNRTYLWLHLAIDSIENACGVGTPRRMAKFIDEIPNSVYQAYESILNRSTDRVEAVELLHIILAAMRPLSLREMNMALNLKPKQAVVDDIDLYPQAHFEKHIRNLCGLFINVYEEDNEYSKIAGDREHSRKIHLIHQTAREFLLEREFTSPTASRTAESSCGKDNSLQTSFPPTIRSVTDRKQQPYGFHRVSAAEPPLWQHSMQIGQAHLLLAQKCMFYLTLECTDDKRLAGFVDNSRTQGSRFMQNVLEERVFLKYTAHHWFHHFASSNDTEDLLPLWRLIYGGVITRYLIADHAYQNYEWFDDMLLPEYYTTLTELMWAICIRHEKLVASLIEESTDLNERDGKGFTALFWAVRCGSPAMVNMLLAKRVSVNARDSDPTRFSESVANNVWFIRNVLRLLFLGQDPESNDRRGWTPLHTAARMIAIDESTRCAVIRLLLDAGADPNLEDSHLRRPLDLCRERTNAAAILEPLTSVMRTDVLVMQIYVWLLISVYGATLLFFHVTGLVVEIIWVLTQVRFDPRHLINAALHRLRMQMLYTRSCMILRTHPSNSLRSHLFRQEHPILTCRFLFRSPNVGSDAADFTSPFLTVREMAWCIYSPLLGGGRERERKMS